MFQPWAAALQRLRFHPRLHWVATVVLAIGTAGLLGGFMQQADANRRSWGESIEVVVTRHPVVAGEPLAAGDLARRRLPLAALPKAEPLLAEAEAVGRSPTTGLAEGEIVLATKLAPVGLRGPSALLATNRGGVAIPWRRGMLEVSPNDTVDLFAVTDNEPGGSQPAALLARSVPVLGRSEDQITVSVAQDDLPAVVAAVQRGEIGVVLAAQH